MSENDIICTVTLHNWSQFWRVMVHFDVRKVLFPHPKEIFTLGKIPFLFSSKISKIVSEMLYICEAFDIFTRFQHYLLGL